MAETTQRGTPQLPAAVKQYTARLGKAGLDYRAIRISRTETAAMLADEQTDIARNSAISTGEMDFVMERGRDAWGCNCEKYAAQSSWKVDDPNRPEIPVHPNCGCVWRPRLKTDAEIMAAFQKSMKEDLETVKDAREEGYSASSPNPDADDNKPLDIPQKTGTDTGDPNIEDRVKNLGVKFVDFSTLEKGTQNEIVDRLENICKDLPAIKGSINTITVINSLDDYGRVSNNRDMELSGKWYNNIEALKRSYDDDVASGFHPQGTDYRSIASHEAVHAGLIAFAKKENRSVNDVAQEIMYEVLNELGLSTKDISKQLSRYAHQQVILNNASDFITEAAAEYKHSAQPRLIASLVYKKLKARFGGNL
jgi:hypothetical protein